MEGVALQPLCHGSGLLVLPAAGDRRGPVDETGVRGRGGRARRGFAGARSSGCPPGEDLAGWRRGDSGGCGAGGEGTGRRPDALAIGFVYFAAVARVSGVKDSAHRDALTRVEGGAEGRPVGTRFLPDTDAQRIRAEDMAFPDARERPRLRRALLDL